MRDRLLNGDVPKGDAVGTARIAGILAAKRVPELVPLCHPVRMDHVDVHMQPDGANTIVVTATVRGTERTGFEIEALHEPRPHPEAVDPNYYDFVTVEWAQKWPAEEIWVARKT